MRIKVGKNRRITLPEGYFQEGEEYELTWTASENSFTLHKILEDPPKKPIFYIGYVPFLSDPKNPKRAIGVILNRKLETLGFVSALSEQMLIKDIKEKDERKMAKIQSMINGPFELRWINVYNLSDDVLKRLAHEKVN